MQASLTDSVLFQRKLQPFRLGYRSFLLNVNVKGEKVSIYPISRASSFPKGEKKGGPSALACALNKFDKLRNSESSVG